MSYADPNLPDLTGHIVDGSQKLLRIVATSAHSVVYESEDVHESRKINKYMRKYAVKCVRYALPGSPDAERQATELRAHEALSSRFSIVTFHRSFIEGDLLFFLLDYQLNGHLRDDPNGEQVPNDLPFVKGIMHQLLGVVEYMHQEGWFHRDLKLEHVLRDFTGQLKIIDFASATQQVRCAEFGFGTPAYMPPEALDPSKGDYSPAACDKWALAIIFFGLITGGKRPWARAHHDDPDYAAFCKATRSRFTSGEKYLLKTFGIRRETAVFLCSCFNSNESLRPTFDDAFDFFRPKTGCLYRFLNPMPISDLPSLKDAPSTPSRERRGSDGDVQTTKPSGLAVIMWKLRRASV
ncbi:Serine/threonine protein kinase [Mycena chlorophos]|uniref:non-specific serine/threonine protein kinase n=1 Tax=Mycena chlorophos TaxID=658473 RepID=A0A8H6W7P1_MYCCL|nr:Serine/threonine protein kinase [Mycena chlorophos]